MDIETTISNTKRGQLTDEMVSNQYNDIIDTRFIGGKESRLVISTKFIKRFMNEKILLSLEGQWIDWENGGFNPYKPDIIGDDVSKFSVNIETSCYTDLNKVSTPGK